MNIFDEAKTSLCTMEHLGVMLFLGLVLFQSSYSALLDVYMIDRPDDWWNGRGGNLHQLNLLQPISGMSVNGRQGY